MTKAQREKKIDQLRKHYCVMVKDIKTYDWVTIWQEWRQRSPLRVAIAYLKPDNDEPLPLFCVTLGKVFITCYPKSKIEAISVRDKERLEQEYAAWRRRWCNENERRAWHAQGDPIQRSSEERR